MHQLKDRDGQSGSKQTNKQTKKKQTHKQTNKHTHTTKTQLYAMYKKTTFKTMMNMDKSKWIDKNKPL